MKYNPSTDWMSKAKYGLLLHYLYGLQNTGQASWSGGLPAAATWDECVDSFDLSLFGRDVLASGAGYVVFTLLQNSGYACSPGELYDRYCGRGYCSKRDLIAEISDALRPHGIKTLVYTSANAPRFNDDIAEKLDYEYNGESSLNPGRSKDGYRSFRDKWYAMMREYSMRWGDKVSGWWVDGCGDWLGCAGIWDDETLAEFSDALKAGNPDSIVCYNPQNNHPYEYEWVNQGVVHAWNNVEDYTAGECFALNTLPCQRWINGMQWNATIYLGTNWAQPGKQYPDAKWIEFMKKAFSFGGAMTIDALIRRDGSLDPAQMEQLAAIKAGVSAI